MGKPGRRAIPRMSFVVQLLVTAGIVASFTAAAHLASSSDDARAFDAAAEETRLEYEGVPDDGSDDR
ncbi:MAG: hypothetical protein AAF389_19390 [Gemmatimonadota bacterium]